MCCWVYGTLACELRPASPQDCLLPLFSSLIGSPMLPLDTWNPTGRYHLLAIFRGTMSYSSIVPSFFPHKYTHLDLPCSQYSLAKSYLASIQI